MIVELKPYQAYKESCQPWLGTVPIHWGVLPNRALFQEKKDRGYQDEPLISVTIARGVIRQADLLTDSAKKDSSNEDKSKYKLVRPGDIAYNKMRAWQGAIGVSDYRGIISPAYIVVRPRLTNNARYFHYLFRIPAFAKEAERWSYGITSDQWSLRPEHFKMIYCCVPPPDEQEAIVRFLGHLNERIGQFIRAKQKSIGLLEEQKQVIIHDAITRGIENEIALKPSRIPEVGEIPKHWEVLRLGRLIKLLTGFPFPSASFSHARNDVRLLRGVNVTPAGIRWEAVVRWHRNPSDGFDEFELQPGDIVLGMDRPIVSSGVRVAAIQPQDTPSLLLQRVARLRPSERLDRDFLVLLLKGRLFANYIAPIFTGISVPHLSPEQIEGFVVAIPPIGEQKQIVAAVAGKTAHLDTAIRHSERQIVLVNEYRTRLTADVVTGKVDVREAAAQLPEPEEAELAKAFDLTNEEASVLESELESEASE